MLVLIKTEISDGNCAMKGVLDVLVLVLEEYLGGIDHICLL